MLTSTLVCVAAGASNDPCHPANLVLDSSDQINDTSVLLDLDCRLLCNRVRTYLYRARCPSGVYLPRYNHRVVRRTMSVLHVTSSLSAPCQWDSDKLVGFSLALSVFSLTTLQYWARMGSLLFTISHPTTLSSHCYLLISGSLGPGLARCHVSLSPLVHRACLALDGLSMSSSLSSFTTPPFRNCALP